MQHFALFAIICLLALTSVGARPTTDTKQYQAIINEDDPMLALPSQSSSQTEQVQYIQYESINNHQSPPAPDVVAHQEAEQQHHQQQQQVVVYDQNQQYQLINQHPQVVEVPHQHNDGVPCNEKHMEYVQVEQQHQDQPPSGEYPGEIIYIGQNGELVSPPAADNQQLASREPQQLGDVVSNLAQNSGVSATILTEIPIRDMPASVLEKLKRDYGVKVVATRERPGANLVINCEDASTQTGGTICAQNTLSSGQEQVSRGEQILYAPAPYTRLEDNHHQGEHAPGERVVYATTTTTTGVDEADQEHREIVYTNGGEQPEMADQVAGYEREAPVYGARTTAPVAEMHHHHLNSQAEQATPTEATVLVNESTENSSEGTQEVAPQVRTTASYVRAESDYNHYPTTVAADASGETTHGAETSSPNENSESGFDEQQAAAATNNSASKRQK